MPEFEVQLGDCSSKITSGDGILSDLGEYLRSELGLTGEEQVLLAVDSAIAQTHGLVAFESLSAVCPCASAVVEANEEQKVMSTVESLWSHMAKNGLDRTGIVVAMGGGIVGDVAGYAAASWMRGVRLVLVPTTLLSMVDASIGGKTGVNVPLPGGSLGKNLAGAFWPASCVFSDISTLDSLEDREFCCGLAESIKHAIISGPSAMDELDTDLDLIMARDHEAIARLVHRSARIKKEIVESDPLERGPRAVLNLGHTFGHAIESRHELGILHGEAVAIGMVAATSTAVALGLAEAGLQDRVEGVIARVGLPTSITGSLGRADMESAMRLDKKGRSGHLRLVLPVELGDVRVVEEPSPAAVEAGFAKIGIV